MKNNGEGKKIKQRKKQTLRWIVAIFIAHFFIPNVLGNNHNEESLTMYPSPLTIAKKEGRLGALLQNVNPLNVLEEVEHLSDYIKKFGTITQPTAAISFFKKLVHLQDPNNQLQQQQIVALGLNFSSTLVSQQAFGEAEIVLDLLAANLPKLPEKKYLEQQSIKVFSLLFTGQEDSALFIAKESLALLAKENTLTPFEKSKYFSDFINVLVQANEQKEAIFYIEIYDAFHKKWRQRTSTPSERNQLDWEYFSLGLHLYSTSGNLEKAKIFYSGIQQLYKIGAHRNINDYNQKFIFNHLINYAIYLRLNKEIEAARAVNLFGIKISTDIAYFDGLSGFYGNLAYLGIDDEKPEDTYKYASKAIEVGSLVGTEQLPNYYNTLAGACIKLNQLEKAKNAILESAKLLLNATIVWDDLLILDFESIKYQDYLVLSFALEGLGYNLTILSNYEGGETFLPIANHFFRLGAAAYTQVVLLNKNTQDIDYLYGNIHEGLLNTCLLLNNCDLDEVLSIAEKNKMLTQMHYLIFNEANLGSFSSSREAIEIKKLQKDLAILHNTKKHKENEKPVNKEAIEAEILSKENKIVQWQATFNENNPQFKSLFNQNINITKLASNLSNDEVVLRYFMFRHQSFLVEITRSEIKLHYLGDSYNIEADIKSFIKVVKTPSSDYIPQAIRVFEKLLPNWNRLKSYTKFSIISDGVLQLLPFEALISNPEKMFLAEQKEVRYAINLSNYEFSSKLQQNTKGGFYVYSPSYSTQIALPGAIKEGRAISPKLHPILRQNTSGTKDNFLKDSKKAKILHVAAHAGLGQLETPSHILFSDDKLYVGELYKREIPAELVVLAACNTGLGSEKGHEAFNSIGQAFSFAGVQTLIYTLWAIPDKQSGTLMTNFYQHLASGENKSSALTLAKRQFLQSASTHERHPYFWSGFILNGHPGKLSAVSRFSRINMWISSTVGVLLITIVLLWIRKKRVVK